MGSGHGHGHPNAGATHRWRLRVAFALIAAFFVVELVSALAQGGVECVTYTRRTDPRQPREVVVEPGDNLRAPYARVEILKGCYRLELSRPGLGDVLIRQKEGFSAPWVRIEAPNLRGEAERFRSDFALERIEAENPRFEFPAGGSFGPCQVEGGSG